MVVTAVEPNVGEGGNDVEINERPGIVSRLGAREIAMELEAEVPPRFVGLVVTEALMALVVIVVVLVEGFSSTDADDDDNRAVDTGGVITSTIGVITLDIKLLPAKASFHLLTGTSTKL